MHSVKMASRQRRPHSSADVHRLRREIMRPVISSDVMGNRNVEVVPVGAWVEPANDNFQPDAVRAAQDEQEKISRQEDAKVKKLRSFQLQTRHRVNEANHLKRLQQIWEAEQAFELERKVVHQSCVTGDVLRKDTCVIRPDLDLAIRKRLLEKYGEDVQAWKEDTSPVLYSHTKESHQVTDKARQQLLSKKIAHTGSDDNPATWRTKTFDDMQILKMRGIVDVRGLPTTYSTSNERTDVDENCHKAGADDTDEDFRKGSQPKSRPSYDDNVDESKEDEKENSGTNGHRRLHFVDENFSDQPGKKKKPKRQCHSKKPKAAQLATILFKDSENDVLARQRRQQTAVSRKIFMDREREAVRENIRRERHQKKIIILKKEKEVYRQELEDMAHRKLEPTDPVTGETTDEVRLREKMESLQMKEVVNKQMNEMRKSQEMKRYLNAMRHTLVEKVNRQGIQLPSLCACGDTVWDTHPDTCANNCFFYKNPRAYARALQSLLLSADVKR